MAARCNVIHISKEKITILIPEVTLLAFAQLLSICDLHHSPNIPMRGEVVYNILIKIWGFEVNI